MKEAQYVFGTVSENEGEFYFDGTKPQKIKNYIRKCEWLRMERRQSDKRPNGEKWFLVADFSDGNTDVNEWGETRNQRLAAEFIDAGLILAYRHSRDDDFDYDYEKFVYSFD